MKSTSPDATCSDAEAAVRRGAVFPTLTSSDRPMFEK